jgi:hypothetical protein
LASLDELQAEDAHAARAQQQHRVARADGVGGFEDGVPRRDAGAWQGGRVDVGHAGGDGHERALVQHDVLREHAVHVAAERVADFIGARGTVVPVREE